MATSTSSQFSISRATPTGSSKPEPSFSPGASPPLILAFLAIGLFAVSMIGVFGWRRIQYSRMVAAGFQDPMWMEFNVVGGRRDVGPRPKLWDMWTTVANPSGTKGQAHEREMEWETIMPIAVMATPASGNRTTADTVGDGTSSASRMRLSRTSIPVRYYQWTRRPERSTTTTNTTATANSTTPEKAAPQPDSDTGRLQVAVAIAMPSRRTIPRGTNVYGDEHRREGDGPGTETDDTLEYTLGVYECDWKHENG